MTREHAPGASPLLLRQRHQLGLNGARCTDELQIRHRCLVIADHRPLWGYPWAFRRFAQDAFSRFDMAFLAAALIGARFRFCVAVGCAGEAALAFLRFAQYAFIRALRATLHAARGFLGFDAALACGLTVGWRVALAGGVSPPPMRLAARCRVSMSLWSWTIWVCLALMALVISLNALSPSPDAGRVHVHELPEEGTGCSALVSTSLLRTPSLHRGLSSRRCRDDAA